MQTLWILPIVLASASLVGAQKFRYALQGERAGDMFGWGVATAGDVDGDGKPDFLVAIPAARTVRAVSGRTGRMIHDFPVSSTSSFAGGQDANRDGHADILIGDSLANRGAGSVVVYSGKTGKPLFTRNGAAGSRFGLRVMWVGDIDRDGRADFMTRQTGGVSSPWTQVVVCSGATGKPLWTLKGFSLYGLASAPGDLDGDGYPEILVHKYYAGTFHYYELYSSRDRKPKWHSDTLNLGYGSCWPGDMNGDGVGDLVISSASQLVAYSGKDGRVLFRTGDVCYSLTAVGDVNGDGLADFAGIHQDVLVVQSGKDGKWIYRMPFRGRPFFVATIGDLDGDKTLEFVIGMPFNTTPPRFAGEALVFSSKYVDPSLSAFGRGCHSKSPPPRFSSAKRTARLGMTLNLTLEQLPGPTTGWLFIGASDQSWSGGRLPLDLVALGMPGCTLLVAPHIRVPFTSTGTSVQLRLAVPFEFRCIGAPVYLQAFCLDKTANALGISTSHALRGLIWP